jgi:hypothetical protein
VQPADDAVTFVLDVLVRDHEGRPLWVVDTKYKNASTPSPEDVAQIVAYATAVHATEAVLVYPRNMKWTARIGSVHVRALGVDLAADVQSVTEVLAAELL